MEKNLKKKCTDLAQEHGVPVSTPNTIVRKSDEIWKDVQHLSLTMKQTKMAQYVNLEEVLLTWLKEVILATINIGGTALQKKDDDITFKLRSITSENRATIENYFKKCGSFNDDECENPIQDVTLPIADRA